MSTVDVPIGAILADKYRVERVLGRGGMGVVVEATQLDLERRVALKFLRRDRVADSGVAQARFEREARMVARLKGAHVVQVYDVGKLEHGEPFIVMELLHGEDLSRILDRERRLPLTQAVDYIVQTCEAMAEAHVAGVVHRDLKPANLFVARGADGRAVVKVLDFGISKLMSAESSTPSLTGGVLGSPLYMSPEQLSSSKQIDHRTDVWSLGAILYELLTGVPAFQGDGVPQICTRIMLEEPALVSELVPDSPPELDQVIARSLQKLADDRYPSVADLALALLPFARRGSHGNVETTVRIVRASSLPHGRLPDAADSLPPPPPESPRPTRDSSAPDAATVESDPDFTADAARPPGARTVDMGGEPGAATQGELKPMMASITEPAPSGLAPRSRYLLTAAVAFLVALALLLAIQGLRSSREEPAKSSASPVAPSAAPVAPPSVASPEPKLEPSVATPVSSASVGPARRPPAPRKPKPAAPTEPSPAELLKHR